MEGNKKILIRKVSHDDFDGLVKLYEEVWPDTDYNKSEKANFVLNESKGVSYLAELDGKIVGSRTSFFQHLYWGNRPLRCVHLGDSCVHSSCRGKGLFLKMNGSFLKDFFSAAVEGEIIYNISVYASRKAYEKLGWHYIESLMALRKFPNLIQVVWHAKLNPRNLSQPIVWDRESKIKQIGIDLLGKREEFFSKTPLLHVRYDAETFSWRMKSKNGIKVFIDDFGAIVYKIGKRKEIVEVLIGEVFLKSYSKNNLRQIIKKLSSSLHPDIISVWVSEGHPLRPWYEDLHFLHNPKQKYLHHGVRVVSEEMKEIAYNPYNWAISSLDIDTF